MTFIYVSGQSTDSSDGGSVMWARVKGATENARARAALQGDVHVPPRLHPADARHQVEHGVVSR